MAQKDLVPMNKRTKEEQKRIARAGGKASGVARRKRKSMKEALELIMEMQATDANKKKMAKKGIDVETNEDVMAAAMTLAAMAGDTKAYSAIANVRGENKQQIEVSASDDKFAEVLDQWKDKREKK